MRIEYSKRALADLHHLAAYCAANVDRALAAAVAAAIQQPMFASRCYAAIATKFSTADAAM